MNNFEKKQWLRLILCALVLIAASLFLTGIIGGEHMTYTLTEQTDAPAVSGTAVEETEQGFGGTVTVHATLDGKTVQALTIDTPDETPGLGQRASEEAFTEQFIGKEGPFTYGENGVDALTGATVTSNAVLKALNRAITGGDAAEEAKTEEAKAEETGRVIYGSYIAKRETNFSTIRVYVDSKGGKITDCRITSEAKMENSDFLTEEIKEAWAKAIVENGTADVDVITGATLKFSSEAVVDAVNEILGRVQ